MSQHANHLPDLSFVVIPARYMLTDARWQVPSPDHRKGYFRQYCLWQIKADSWVGKDDQPLDPQSGATAERSIGAIDARSQIVHIPLQLLGWVSDGRFGLEVTTVAHFRLVPLAIPAKDAPAVMLGLESKDPVGTDEDMVYVISATREIEVIDEKVIIAQTGQHLRQKTLALQTGLELLAEAGAVVVGPLIDHKPSSRQYRCRPHDQRHPPALSDQQYTQHGYAGRRREQERNAA